MGRIDLHTHTLLSDGELLPTELASRAEELDHDVLGLTDHVGLSNLDDVVDQTVKAAERISESMDIDVIPGVELSYVPISLISDLAEEARGLGAKIIVVHGETMVEPVPPGTNIAALKCEDVDILAHPGIISQEEVELAENTGTYLEITSRRGHSLTNGRVVKLAGEIGAKLLVNTDAHSPDDLITYQESEAIALGAGCDEDALETILKDNPNSILEERV
ncbi:hypothetical protein AKJ49_00250 [candidate division MSBL1 archaeon SCGC-AAA382A03]|uniref:Polymerase/histidinol phosphatase N-terminal domain-containing protein n=1 Tax=candidate division MSBL1 archaeon SCGC-AAA382A03 TaxID=1698278 RepID=A0A133VGY8_9EURY|nr:hypothetical protein AKJ49_00250 [candidate division MSBL1 archaeon SCGC-AAA382A03]